MVNPVRAWAAFVADPLHDRLFMGSPLRRGRVSIVISVTLLILLVVATLTQLGELARLRMDRASAVFFAALGLSSLLAAVPLAVLWFLERRERESPWLFAVAFIWGACIATAISAPFNTAFFSLVDSWVKTHPAVTQLLGPEAAILLAAPLSAPIVEEIAKALGVIALFWLLRAEFDGMRDGIVYGALVGVGFNWMEAASYVAQDYVQYGKATYGAQLGGRYALFGLSGHALFSAMFGASLGFALQTPHRWLRMLAPIAGLVLGIAAHMFNNAQPLLDTLNDARSGRTPERESVADMGFLESFVGSSVSELIMFLPFIVVIAVALWRSGVWERRVIREELAEEVGNAITQSEYQAVAGDRIFYTRRIAGMSRHAAAALVNAQNELAFRKRRVRVDGGAPENDALVSGWRQQIEQLRAAS